MGEVNRNEILDEVYNPKIKPQENAACKAGWFLCERRVVDKLKEELLAAKSELKNFHRLVCESAGYHHDEINWKRDQASLINHLDSKLSQIRGGGEK